MKLPTFAIQLFPNPRDSRVTCNGVDISAAIQGIKVSQDPHSALHLELTIVPTEVVVTLDGEIQDVILHLRSLSDVKPKLETRDAPTEP